MQTTRNRISKIEQRIGPRSPGKFVVMRGGSTDAEATELLKVNGIDPDDRTNTVVVLRTFFEGEAGGEYSSPSKPEILYVMDKAIA